MSKTAWTAAEKQDGVLVGVALILTGLVLLPVERRWAYNYQITEHDVGFWVAMVLVVLYTIVAAEATWRFLWRRHCLVAPVFGFAAVVAAYRVFYPIANGALDRATGEQQVYVIGGRDCITTRRGRPSLSLHPVATPDSGGFTLRVSRRYCRQVRDGQEVLLDVMPGFFGTRWVARYELRP